MLTNEGLPAGGRAATIVANTLGAAPAGHVAFNVNTLRSNVNPDETPIAGAKRVFIISNNDPGVTAGPTGTITISGNPPESTDAAKLVALNNTQVTTGADGGTPSTAPGNITITTDTLSVSNATQIYTIAFSEDGTPAGNISFNVNTLRANTMPDGTLITGVPQVLIGSAGVVREKEAISLYLALSPRSPMQPSSLRSTISSSIRWCSTVPHKQRLLPHSRWAADTVYLSHSTNIKTDTQGAAR